MLFIMCHLQIYKLQDCPSWEAAINHHDEKVISAHQDANIT